LVRPITLLSVIFLKASNSNSNMWVPPIYWWSYYIKRKPID
jgi:hypothetical protein